MTDEQINALWADYQHKDACGLVDYAHKHFARAIESAATKPLLERIAALEAKLAQRVPDPTAITQAVARGWCHPKNSHKVMDSDLAFAISDEVYIALSATPAAPEQQEPTDSMGVPMSCGKPLCSPGDHHPLCAQADHSEQHLDMVAQAPNAQQAEAQEPGDAALLKALNAIKPMDRTKLFEMAVPLTQEEIAEAESDRAIPKAWANFTANGNIRIWSKKPESAAWSGLDLEPLFTRPQPAQLQALTIRECAEATGRFAHVWSDDMLGIAEVIQSALAAKNGAVLK